MASVFDVAKYILSKTGTLSTMKLQKLVYYSQAWSLVWDEEPLFSESIEAWANGPVIPILFDSHRGLFSISRSSYPAADVNNLSKSQKETIDKVVEYYNKYDSATLSDLTHREDPWRNARKRACVSEGERCDEEISLPEMQMYYESL